MAEAVTASRAGSIVIGDVTVNRIGLGTNRIADTPEAHALLKRAVELEINFIDTAYRYGSGTSETTIGNTLAPYPQGLLIATKGGMGDGASPEALRRELDESLQRLQTDRVELYTLHRVDPNVDIETSIGALKELHDEGKIGQIGLSEATVEQIERARTVSPIAAVQNEYNVLARQWEAEVDYCEAHDIAFVPWFPLGGLRGDAEKVSAIITPIAERYGASAQQLALAWLLRRSPVILPIPGTLSIAHLEDNLRGGAIELSDEDYETLSAAAPAA